MRRLIIIIAIIILPGCVARTPDIPDRKLAVAKIPTLRVYENRRGLLSARLAIVSELALKIDEPRRVRIQDAADLAFIYYYAAIIALAEGRNDTFAVHISHAQAELDRANALLLEAVRELEF